MAGKDELEALEVALVSASALDDKVSAASYTTGYKLDVSEQNFAIAYEVARRSRCSLEDAVTKYQMLNTSLGEGGAIETQVKDTINSAVKQSTHDKPTIIMVNYKLASGGDHWAPIVVSKDAKNVVSVTRINSMQEKFISQDDHKKSYLDFGIPEEHIPALNKTKDSIRFFQDRLVSAFPERDKVVSGDATRDVQIDQVCGFASADAIAIGIKAISENEGEAIESAIKKAITHDTGQQRKIKGKEGKEAALSRQNAYIAQGKRSFAVMEYLNFLGDDKIEALRMPVLNLEKVALLSYGYLNQEQSNAIKNSEQLDEVLITKIKESPDKSLSNSSNQSSYEEDAKMALEIQNMQLKGVGGAESKSVKEIGENIKNSYAEDSKMALEMQNAELNRAGGAESKSVKEIGENIKNSYAEDLKMALAMQNAELKRAGGVESKSAKEIGDNIKEHLVKNPSVRVHMPSKGGNDKEPGRG